MDFDYQGAYYYPYTILYDGKIGLEGLAVVDGEFDYSIMYKKQQSDEYLTLPITASIENIPDKVKYLFVQLQDDNHIKYTASGFQNPQAFSTDNFEDRLISMSFDIKNCDINNSGTYYFALRATDQNIDQNL